MKTILIILISLLSLSSYSQVTTKKLHYHKDIELRKANKLIISTFIPSGISIGLGAYLFHKVPNDPTTYIVPFTGAIFFLGVGGKAIKDKRTLKFKEI